jgi:hypothetical protein
MENCLEIKENTNQKLIISVKGDLFLRTLLFIILFSLGLFVFSFLFYMKIDLEKWKPPILILATSFAITGGYLLFKLIHLLVFQSFTFDYVIEKISEDKAVFYTKSGFLQYPARTIPEKFYLLDYPVNFLGKHGFIVYIFGGSSKETLIGGNFLIRMMYTLMNPPFMRVELRFNSYEQAKEIGKQVLFEIRKILREDRKVTGQEKKTLLMKSNLSPEEIRSLVKSGIDVNARDTIVGNTALFYAAGCDPEKNPSDWEEPNYPAIAELIRNGADVNACNFYNERIIDYYRRLNPMNTVENPSFSRLKSYLITMGYRH